MLTRRMGSLVRRFLNSIHPSTLTDSGLAGVEKVLQILHVRFAPQCHSRPVLLTTF